MQIQTSMSVARQICRDLPKGTFVLRPDFNELLEGPDAIVEVNGRLVAILVIRSHERADVEVAKARLALTKLALPDHARFVLVSNGEKWSYADASPHVEKMVELQDAGHYLRAVKGSAARKHLVPKEMRHAHALLTEIVLTHTAQFNESAPHEPDAKAATTQGSHRWRYKENVGDVRVFGQMPGDSHNNGVPPAIVRASATRLFELEDGAPRFRGKLLSVLMTDLLKPATRDPAKPMLASAFAGLAAIKQSDWGELQHFLTRLMAHTNRARLWQT